VVGGDCRRVGHGQRYVVLKIAALSSDVTYNSLDVFNLRMGEAVFDERKRNDWTLIGDGYLHSDGEAKLFRNQWFHMFRLTRSSRLYQLVTRVSVLRKRYIPYPLPQPIIHSVFFPSTLQTALL